ncbi:hypothetical protein CYY_004274 [Polysphondylium violaceum]|uniref:Uncharacterized protein n=1 Tax=Polysphondylium violaceum TaxID=133409 RepID=A0A8J4PTK1_9MYCE|nr:hypothetical protein CYY_004274 [Polysphondylium violaceum]
MRWKESIIDDQFSFLYSIGSFIFLFLVQLAGLGVIAYGLFYFFDYNHTNDYRLPLLWAAAVFSTIACIFISVSSFTSHIHFLKFGILIMICTFLYMEFTIGLLIWSRDSDIKKLKYCRLPVEESTCVPVWNQPFCGVHIQEQCNRTQHGFFLILAGQITISAVHIFYLIFSVLQVVSLDRKSKYVLIN